MRGEDGPSADGAAGIQATAADRVALEDLAAVREVAYRLLAQAFLPPTARRFEEMRAFAEALDDCDSGFCDLAFYPVWWQFPEAFGGFDGIGAESFAAPYVALFQAAPGEVPAPLFESALLRDKIEDAAMVVPKLEIEYRAAGLKLTRAGGEEPDLVSVELEFMAFLCGVEAGRWKHGEVQQAGRELKRQRRFLREHLEPCLLELAARLERADPDGPYAAAAAAALAFAAHDMELQRGLIGEVDVARIVDG